MRTWRLLLAIASLTAWGAVCGWSQEGASAPPPPPASSTDPAPAAAPAGQPIEISLQGEPPAEGERIEATVEELERLINAPAEARLGREVDEPDQPFALFQDKDRVDELLGKDPRYVYIPAGSDPMIVPWVRNRVMAEELVAEAKELMAGGKYDEALGKVKTVLERFSDAETEAVGEARRMRERLDTLIAERNEVAEVGEISLEVPAGPQPVLPAWIPENTKGIIFDVKDPDQSTVLIGEYILKVGDSIPSYPGITVYEIKKGMVTLDYQGTKFRLLVEGN